MPLGKVQEIIANNKEKYLEQLFILLRQKSISTQNEGIAECAELLKKMMEEFGISTQIMQTNGHPVVYGEIIKDPNFFTLLIYGHYDVQPPEPIDDWISPPFEPTIRNGRIYCRGAGDNKGQLMAQLLGVKTYLNIFGDLPINIKFLFEGEEENGSPNLSSFVKENKELLNADLVYTADGSSHNSGSPLILLGVRGSLCLELKAKLADWDNHSGNTGNILPNPAWKLINLLQTMCNQDGQVLIEGFYDHIRPPSKHEKELLQTLPFDAEDIGNKIGYPHLHMDSETYYHKLTMEPTFNINGIQSGYTGEGIKTIIPATATVKIDARLVVDQDPMDIYNKICQHVQQHDPDIEVTYLSSMEPSRTSADLEIVKVVTNAIHHAYQQEPLIQPSLGGSLPDYVWTKILEVPSIIMPYANFDQKNHSPNENIEIDYFLNGIKCTCHVIHELGKHAKKLSNEVYIK
ncbi:M20/M25/M40 family metallo-hydrolase [Cytobacillus depressus]|uniref:M20/M25/M40 family metallo-hydrolase n=1 Tax=Cytobacillus depressus TaxID=1602942 RepID=A0A6L3V8B1_9BACI|nr:M20/M25/M40 family metallo-hydrolase [Cytobacillus depressus]KAB2336671.1 M20/M25/M40 family metallo-hydrolase [Cytobacillus depressus]